MQFNDPYLYGLLNKRKDLLTFDMYEEAMNVTLLYNSTNDTIDNNSSSCAIPMQFDYRDPLMISMRNASRYLYYIMSAIVSI